MLRGFYGETTMGECKVPLLIPIYNVNSHEALLINSNDHAWMPLADVVNASSAAPTFFPPVHVADEDDWYVKTKKKGGEQVDPERKLNRKTTYLFQVHRRWRFRE